MFTVPAKMLLVAGMAADQPKLKEMEHQVVVPVIFELVELLFQIALLLPAVVAVADGLTQKVALAEV
jgi:hypothetical protein